MKMLTLASAHLRNQEPAVSTLLITTPGWSHLLDQIHSGLSWISMIIGLAIGVHTMIGWLKRRGDQ